MLSIFKNAMKKSIELYGKTIKEVICMEELAELQQQVSKDIRGQLDRDHLIEEFGDVVICLEWLKIIHNISDEEINQWIKRKMIRQYQRDKEYRAKLKNNS